MTEGHPADPPPVTELTFPQRRVLGVLVEKAFTTPDAYPLTLKALTTGCNQKSNRHPVTNYTEEDVEGTLDELRELRLVGIVHTASGRTERFRHYMRQRFPFSEPQLAVMTELLLRGRQTIGELRSRASRMVSIESLDELRRELHDLRERGYLQANGPLERRGVEVDHMLYGPSEGRRLADSAEAAPQLSPPVAAEPSGTPGPREVVEETGALRSAVEQLRAENRELREELAEVRQQLQRLSHEFDQFRRDLGG